MSDKRELITKDWFVIADTHFFHDNIAKYEDRPENHNYLILKNWNRVVQQGDRVLHLGDLTLGDKQESRRLIKQLNGKKFIILGNHDKKSNGWYRDLGFTVIMPTYQFFNNGRTLVLVSHEPDKGFDEGKMIGVNVHGHIHLGKHREFYPKHPKRFINVSVEVINYTPKRIGDLIP